MAQENQDGGLIRRYLLGRLREDELERLEEKIMADTEFFNQVLLGEDELIEEYVQGDLTEADRTAFEVSVLATPQGRQRVSYVRALRKFVAAVKPTPLPVIPTVWWRRPTSVSYLAAAAIILIALGLVIEPILFPSRVTKGVTTLAYAYRDQRPLESRISGFNYAPTVTTRGSEQKVDQVALNRASGLLHDAEFEDPNPAAHHALGRLYLAEKKFDEAIAQFDEALKTDPNNASLHSDYGAALMEKGRADNGLDSSGKGLEELAKGLGHLNKALELDGTRLEALFNRALVHREMLLPRQAEDDWRKYLELDSSSQWANEARQNIKLLEEELKKTSRTTEGILQEFLSAYDAADDESAWRVIAGSREALSRKLIWEQLLDKYLESAKGESDGAAKGLGALSYAGRLEYQRCGDRFVLGLAKFYSSASSSNRDVLAKARRFMKQGHECYFQLRLNEAIDHYLEAHQLFKSLGDEWETQYAQHWIGYCYLEQGKTQLSLSTLKRLELICAERNYKWLRMRTLHLLSTDYHNLNEYSKAIAHNLEALSIAQQIADTIGIFNASSVLAFQYSSTGNNQKALSYVQKSLNIFDDCPLNGIQSARHYLIVALAFSGAELYNAAIDYEKEALRRDLEINHLQHISLDYARLGLMYRQLGNPAEALASIALARQTASSISDETVRKNMMAQASLQMGHVYREDGDWLKAIESYDDSIALSDHIHFKYSVYLARKNRLLCYIASGSDDLAKAELQNTLDQTEKYRDTIVESENRNGFFELEQSAYDLAIDFEYSRMNDPEKAFAHSEESRARSLLDSVNGHASISENKDPDLTFKQVSRPLSLSQIQARLPEDAQVIQYAVLSEKILIWYVSKTNFSIFEKKVSQQALTKKVSRYIQLGCGPTWKREESESAAKDLFEILIRPLIPTLDRNKPVYLVPDKALNSLPFGALVSSDSGTFLIEDYVLAYSPSSTLLVLCSELARTKLAGTSERLLSVGNPRFDRADFPSLADLPSAAREAEQISGYYEPARLLLNKTATLDQVGREMLRSDVVHLALHSVVDNRSPMRSKLVLAKQSSGSNRQTGSDGALQTSDIYKSKLPRTRLVVLSTCESGGGRYCGGEGMMSMARPFLAATVPLVVVSFWPVDSDATAEFMISFHAHRKRENISTVEALRSAQVEMLRSHDERLSRPYCWASFVAIGGHTSY